MVIYYHAERGNLDDQEHQINMNLDLRGGLYRMLVLGGVGCWISQACFN